MLTTLTIKNFVLIDDLTLEFSPGFTVITGETGAGKSLIFDALALIAGKKASGKLVKPGTESAVISASFTDFPEELLAILEELGILVEEELVIRRVIKSDGTGRSWINNLQVNREVLLQVAGYLLSINTQHAQYSMFKEGFLLEVIDEYSENHDLREELNRIYRQIKQIEQEITALDNKQEISEEQLGFCQQAKQELEQLAMEEDEEIKLLEKRQQTLAKQQNQQLWQFLDDIFNGEDKLLAQLKSIQLRLLKLSEDEISPDWLQKLDQAEQLLADVSFEISQRNDGETIEENLEEIETRISKIRALARKYKQPSSALNDYLTIITNRLDEVENREKKKQEASEKLQALWGEYSLVANKINDKRQKAIKALSSKLAEELPQLNLAQAKFEFKLVELAKTEWNSKGNINIDLLLSPNPGQPLQPVTAIASGGELSRILLALLILVEQPKFAITMIFDEIDIGISGSTAYKVGSRLVKLATKQQILAITHQPQVAAQGKHHLYVAKKHFENSTKVEAKFLADQERVNAIAQMVAGDEVTENAMKAASELLLEASYE